MNTENIKPNETHKFALSLSQKLDLKNSDELVTFQNLFITRGKISGSSKKQQTSNNSTNVE